MRNEVILYIAASQDGYIADKDGKLDFLPDIPSDGYDFGYKEMYASVDAIIMGRTTYDYIVNHISNEQWPYTGKKCYVYSHKPNEAYEDTEFVNEQPEVLLQRIYSSGAKRIWLMGGGQIIRMFLQKDLVDVFDLFYVPVLLGDGIPLFPVEFSQVNLVLEKSETRGGLVELLYHRERKNATNN